MAAVNPTYLSGYGGKVKLDAVDLPVTDWSGDADAGNWDATNADTAGWSHPERTIRSMNGSFNAVWKKTGGKPAFTEGLIYPIELSTQPDEGYGMNALITKITPKVEIKGGVTYSVSYMSQGPVIALAP